jgi:Na+/H+ antiporter NhaA
MKSSNLPYRKNLFNPIRELAENGRLSGILMILATVLSIIFSNSGNGSSYLKIWDGKMYSRISHLTSRIYDNTLTLSASPILYC